MDEYGALWVAMVLLNEGGSAKCRIEKLNLTLGMLHMEGEPHRIMLEGLTDRFASS